MNRKLTSATTCYFILLLALLTIIKPSLGYLYIRNATKKALGTVIPWPKSVSFYNPKSISYLQIKPTLFRFTASEELNDCDIIQEALKRYADSYLFEDVRVGGKDDRAGERIKVGNLEELKLAAASKGFHCEKMPDENMNEQYELNLRSNPPTLISNSTWGFLRGLETFSQLVFYQEIPDNSFGVPTLFIQDEPKYNFRGFMLDTARHFISVKNIKTILDAMASCKLNVFHWHLVDDQSFPYESSAFPYLAKKSAFKPNQIYHRREIIDIIEYARLRGIRVLPELDTPGHTYSLRHINGLLTHCYNTTSGKPNGDFGPIDPTKVENLHAIAKLISDFAQIFHDSYFHGGGDEVDYDCWKSNPKIREWMSTRNMTGDYQALANVYIKKIFDIVTHYNKSLLVWQEVFDSNAQLPKNSIIQVWKYRNDRLAYSAEMRSIVSAGYRAILSSCWYLNYIDYGQDWIPFYKCDPSAGLSSSDPLHDLVLGGEICMWSEFVDDTNVVTRSWPRSAAAAERLWSQPTKNNPSEFLPRLEQYRCRLLARQIQAEPVNGPGYC